MKPTSQSFRAVDLLLVGLLAALAGCASSPIAQSTAQTGGAPPVAATHGGSFQGPIPLRTVTPEYPFTMRRSGTSGVVNVNCLIDEKGHVQEAKVKDSTDNAFDKAALAAALQWTFRPARRDGVAVSARANLPIVFTFAEP